MESWPTSRLRVRLVAEHEGNVVAFACGLENRSPALFPASDCELWAIYTHPSEFRKGARSSLLVEFKSRMRLMGRKQLCIWTLRDNSQARLFYKAQGGVLGHATKEIKIGEQSLSEVVYEFGI